MNKNDIPVILLKGAFFAAHLYPDASLRPMSDIDLLFKSEDIHRARDLIISLGYSQTPGGARQSPLHERISLLQGEHLPSLEKAGITRIEMHSNISGQDAASVWLRSIHHTMDGLHFYSLSPEHQILYCCAHLRHHIRQGSLTFYWLCDIHEILRKYERDMDWDFVFRSASTTGIDVAVLSTLAFMKKEWHSPTPEILAETEELDIFKGLDDPWKEVKLTVPDYYEKLKLVRHAGDWNERFLYLRGLVFPSRTFMLDTYQPKDFLSLCLCYAIHPFTRIRRIAVSLFFNTLSIVKRSV